MPQNSLRWLLRPLSTWSQFLFLWSSPCQIWAPGSSLLLWFSLWTWCLCLVTLRFDSWLSLVQFSLDYPWTLPEPSWLTTGLVQPLPHCERGTGQFEYQMLEPAFPWDKPININRYHRSMWLSLDISGNFSIVPIPNSLVNQFNLSRVVSSYGEQMLVAAIWPEGVAWNSRQRQAVCPLETNILQVYLWISF